MAGNNTIKASNENQSGLVEPPWFLHIKVQRWVKLLFQCLPNIGSGQLAPSVRPKPSTDPRATTATHTHTHTHTKGHKKKKKWKNTNFSIKSLPPPPESSKPFFGPEMIVYASFPGKERLKKGPTTKKLYRVDLGFKKAFFSRM